MRLPRMTTRRWMIAVVIFGLLMGSVVGAIRLKRRHDDFVVRAQYHARREAICKTLEGGLRGSFEQRSAIVKTLENGQRSEPPGESPARLAANRTVMEARVAKSAREAAHHGPLARKDERAARYPWLPVESDPPEPD